MQPLFHLHLTRNPVRIAFAILLTVLCVGACVWLCLSPDMLAAAVDELDTQEDLVEGGAPVSPYLSKNFTLEYEFTVPDEHPYLEEVGVCLAPDSTDPNDDWPQYTMTLSREDEVLASEVLDLQAHFSVGEYWHYYFLTVEQLLQPDVTYTLSISCDAYYTGNTPGMRVSVHPVEKGEFSCFETDDGAFAADFSITTASLDYSLYYLPLILMAIAWIVAMFSLLGDIIWCGRRPSLIVMILFNGVLCAFFALCAVENLNNSGGIFYMDPAPILVNLITYICLYLLLYAPTGSPFFSICFVSVLLTVGSVVNYFTLRFRGTPVMPTDLFAATTAANVMGQYEIGPDPVLLWSGAMTLCVCAIAYMVAGRPITRRAFLHAGMRLAGLGGSLAFLMILNTTGGCIALQVPTNAWDPTSANQQNGFVVHFVENARSMFLSKPDGYSSTRIEEISSRYDATSETDQMPNIIFIMNESLADFEANGELLTSQPILPYLHSLSGQSNALTGYVQIPASGGGTSTSEFQALTGISDRDYYATAPYATHVLRETPSLPSVLSELGYTSIAAHPAQAGNWNRDRAYERLGFDEFYDISKLRGLVNLRGLATDSSFYTSLEELAQQTSEPLFLFAVTIQNHGGYDYEDFDESIRILSPAGDYPLATQYLNLARLSDDAFQELTSYYSEVDEPTLIVMFGDHFPAIETDFIYDVCSDEPNSSLPTHLTPYVVWANYDLEKENLPEDGEIISVSFLQSVLMDAAGLPKTGWQQFLSDVMDEYPVVSKFGTLDAQGELVDDSLDIPLLQDYSCLQYNLLSSSRSRAKAFFSFTE